MLSKKDIIKLRDFFDREEWQRYVNCCTEDGEHLNFDEDYQRESRIIQGWAETLRFISKMKSLKKVNFPSIQKDYEELLRAPDHNDLKCCPECCCPKCDKE